MKIVLLVIGILLIIFGAIMAVLTATLSGTGMYGSGRTDWGSVVFFAIVAIIGIGLVCWGAVWS